MSFFFNKISIPINPNNPGKELCTSEIIDKIFEYSILFTLMDKHLSLIMFFLITVCCRLIVSNL